MFGKMGNLFGDMEEKQEKLREELKNFEIVEEAKDGTIKVTANGIREIVNISISQELVSGEETEKLEDLLVITINRALQKAAEKEAKESQKLINDMLPPGMKGLRNLFGK